MANDVNNNSYSTKPGPAPACDNPSLFNHSNPITTTKFYQTTTVKVKKKITSKLQQYEAPHQETQHRTAYNTQIESKITYNTQIE